MAQVFPFQPYRYTGKAGRLADLVTQPYDKISPDMRSRYAKLNPYNLVRVILGEREKADSELNNVYTRAAGYLNSWIAEGVLARELEPSLYAYFQEFAVPDTGEKLVRKGFIGLGAVVDYAAAEVYRHEQTLSGPKKDRLELLRQTRAHCEQLFMLYPDPAGEIDGLLDQAAQWRPAGDVTDEYGVAHRFWKISDAATVARIQALMSDKKLLIADGHHRYETAMAFRDENPQLPGAAKVVMTFVNMHSPGLKILATHRLVSGLPAFDREAFLRKAEGTFQVEEIGSADRLREAWRANTGTVIGAAIGSRLWMLQPRETGETLDVRVLHNALLAGVLGVGEEAVREERNLRYIRGLDAAMDEARAGAAQIAFLLKPTSVEQVASISFGGGVMPQKSTDFYPKLLSGLTIYKVD